MKRDFKINNKILQKERWLYVLLGIIIMMFLGTVYSYSVFRIPLEEQFQIGSTESGLPYMTSLAFYAIFMFLTGKYIGKYSPRVIILTGGLLVVLGWIMSSFATNIIMLTITYGCIGGAGVGIAYGAPMNVVAKWFPEKKGFAVGMVLIGFGLSPLITAPLARFLVESFGVMQTFLILGVSLSVLLPVVVFPLRYPREIDIKQVEYAEGKVDETLNVQIHEMIRMKSFRGVYLNFVIGTMIGLMLIGSTVNIGVDYAGMD
jgi:MFS family permease